MTNICIQRASLNADVFFFLSKFVETICVRLKGQDQHLASDQSHGRIPIGHDAFRSLCLNKTNINIETISTFLALLSGELLAKKKTVGDFK